MKEGSGGDTKVGVEECEGVKGVYEREKVYYSKRIEKMKKDLAERKK